MDKEGKRMRRGTGFVIVLPGGSATVSLFFRIFRLIISMRSFKAALEANNTSDDFFKCCPLVSKIPTIVKNRTSATKTVSCI